MKRFFSISLLSCVCLALQAQQPLSMDQVRSKVEHYYSTIHNIIESPTGSDGALGVVHLTEIIGKDANGQSFQFMVPNDVGELVSKEQKQPARIMLSSYVENLRNGASHHNLSFSYRLLSLEYLTAPTISKSSVPTYFIAVVEKQFATRQSKGVFHDTLFVNAEGGYIYGISNGEIVNTDGMDYNQCYMSAIQLYDSKQYDRAYRMFQESLKKDPYRDRDAAYYLGVMTFKGQGCKQYPRKVRDYLAEFYFPFSRAGKRYLSNILMYDFTSYVSYHEVDPFPSNRLLARNNRTNLYGFISPQGKMVIKQKYKAALPFFTDGTAIVITEKECLRIDTIGRIVAVYKGVKRINGSYQLMVWDSEHYGVIDIITGAWVIPMEYDDILPYLSSVGTGFYFVTKKGKVGALSSSGEWYFQPKYDYLDILTDLKSMAIKDLPPYNYKNIDHYESIYQDELGVRIQCIADYDKKTLEQLKKQYKDPDKIPKFELEKIGIFFELTTLKGQNFFKSSIP